MFFPPHSLRRCRIRLWPWLLALAAAAPGQAADYFHARRERLALFEGEIIPQARQTAHALMAGYEVGRADFSDLLRAELPLFQYQGQYWRSLARTQQIPTELAAAVGGELGRE